MHNINNTLLIAQISSALAAVIQHSANYDCGVWPPMSHQEDKISLGALLDYKLKLTGLESLNIANVIVRFDVELTDCHYDDTAQLVDLRHPDIGTGLYTCAGTEHHVWGGSCEHNLTFESANGEILENYGEGGLFLGALDGMGDVDMAESIVEKAFAQLSPESKDVFFKDVLHEYNIMHQIKGLKPLVKKAA